MLHHTIITKARVYDNEPQEVYKENVEKLATFGLSEESNVLCHFFNSKFFDEQLREMQIYDAWQMLAAKDGIDMVKFCNGNIGFVAYNNGEENAFEIIG